MLVIGILNYPEQKLLNRIKTENDKKEGNPPLFVIHNLQTFSLKEQVEDYIKEILLKSATFKLKEMKYIEAGNSVNNEKLNDKYFIEIFEDKKYKKQIYHLIMAMHGTNAGEYYNPFVYKFLSQQFTSQSIHQKFPIIDDVKEQFCDCSHSIMEKAIDLADFEESDNEIKLKCSDEKGKVLKFKKCLIDELGFSSFYGTNFEPKYSYNKTIIDKKPYIAIKVEIPGESDVKCKANNKNGLWIITISGKKKINNEDENDIEPKLSKSTREDGKFELVIKLDGNDFQLAEKKPDNNLTKSIEGLKCFYFKLIEDNDSSESEKEDKSD